MVSLQTGGPREQCIPNLSWMQMNSFTKTGEPFIGPKLIPALLGPCFALLSFLLRLIWKLFFVFNRKRSKFFLFFLLFFAHSTSENFFSHSTVLNWNNLIAIKASEIEKFNFELICTIAKHCASGSSGSLRVLLCLLYRVPGNFLPTGILNAEWNHTSSNKFATNQSFCMKREKKKTNQLNGFAIGVWFICFQHNAIL